jgi:hypothetical protein
MHSKTDHYKLHQNYRNDEFWIVDCVSNVADAGNYKMALVCYKSQELSACHSPSFEYCGVMKNI